MVNKQKAVILAVFVLAIGLGCSAKKDPAEKAATAETPAEAPKPADESAPEKPTMDKLSASHILLMYAGSERAPAEVKRTKEEALALAKELHGKLKGGADFAALAKEHSDCPSKAQGGDLGTFPAGAMAPAFSDGVRALKDGAFSEPVETPFGYHIIKRQEVVPPVTLSASFIVILHEKSMPNPPNEKRTKEEALARAKEALEKIKGGAKFADIAKEYSDHPNKVNGGNMGNFESDMVPQELAAAVQTLNVGDVSAEPLELPLGFHVIQRQELAESIPMSASIILVMHKDSMPNPVNATRTKKEALKRAVEAIAKLKKGKPFAEIVKEYSDHPNKEKGGDLGVFLSDKMPPALVDAVKAVKVDEFSPEPIDLPIGYHVFLRQEAKEPVANPAQPPTGHEGHAH